MVPPESGANGVRLVQSDLFRKPMAESPAVPRGGRLDALAVLRLSVAGWPQAANWGVGIAATDGRTAEGGAMAASYRPGWNRGSFEREGSRR